MRIVVIYNPQSGPLGKRCKPVRQIDRWMREEGFRPEWRATQKPGDGSLLAREALAGRPDLVVAYGGDGTMNEVASALAGGAVPMGVLPGGTGNVLADELGIPCDPRRALRVLKTGCRRRVSLGAAGDRPFLLWAGIGLDAAIAATIPRSWKRTFGKMGFLMHGLLFWLRHPLPSFQLRMDGADYSAGMALLANARCYGGGLRPLPHAEMTSGFLDVCLLPDCGRVRYLRYLWAARTGRLGELPGVTVTRTRSACGLGPPGVPVQIDGECIGSLPMDFRILPDALTLMVPEASVPGSLD